MLCISDVFRMQLDYTYFSQSLLIANLKDLGSLNLAVLLPWASTSASPYTIIFATLAMHTSSTRIQNYAVTYELGELVDFQRLSAKINL